MSLTNLPNEMLWDIFLYFNPKELALYELVESRFWDIIRDPIFRQQYAQLHNLKHGILTTQKEFNILYVEKKEIIDIGEWDLNRKIGVHRKFYRRWFLGGNIRSYQEWSNGVQNGITRTWHLNGNLGTESNYVDGIKEGMRCEWYENGQLKTQENYVHGKREGIIYNWYVNGKLHLMYNIDTGLRQEWLENGQLKIEETVFN